MEEEVLEDDEWLKMDKPPEWMQPVEAEEYDEWTPPPRQPLLPPPAPVSEQCRGCEVAGAAVECTIRSLGMNPWPIGD